MSTHERVARMYAHQEADRILITDSPWRTTIERWQREGMPEDVHYVDYFGLDRFAQFGVDNCTRQYLGLPLFVAGARVTAEMMIEALCVLLPPELRFLISDRGTHFSECVQEACAQPGVYYEFAKRVWLM